MKSIKARLGSGLILMLVLIFSLQWVLVSLTIRHVTEDYITTRMDRDIDSLLAGITFTPAGLPELIREPDGLYDRGPFSGHYYQIIVDDYILRSRSFWDKTLDIFPVTPGTSATQRILGPLEQPLLVLSKGFRKQGRELTISVAEDMSAVDASKHQFQQFYFLLSTGILLLLLLIQQWIVHRSLRSLTATRFDLERITRGEAEKLPADVPTEIKPLVQEVNTLLDLLAQRLVKTRTAVGNLAHALKTPLSLITQMVNEKAIVAEPDLQQRMQHQVITIYQALERELNRARLAGDGKSGRRFNPAQDLPRLINTLKQIHQDKPVTITLDCARQGSWPADREDMLELFGNLADNACKWARQQVRITLDNQYYRFVVEDDGPGCPVEQLENLSQRGVRLDENVRGHGLGLSIVKDIVSHYRGTVKFDRSPELQGLKVTVEILS